MLLVERNLCSAISTAGDGTPPNDCPAKTDNMQTKSSHLTTSLVNLSYWHIYSGVQRLLDARGRRGSWMPSKIFSIRPAKFLTTFFLVICTKFLDYLQHFLHFTKIPSLDAPSAASCPCNDICLFIFCHLRTFLLRKLALWMPPRVDARGHRTVRTPLYTPLHI